MYLGRLVTEEFLFSKCLSGSDTMAIDSFSLSLSLSLSDCFYTIHFQHDVSGLVGRPFVKRWFALCYRTVILSVLSVCNVAKRLDGSRWNLPQPHCIRWGSSPPPKKGHSPQFLAHVCCGQTAGWVKIPLSAEVGLGPGDIVLDGDPAPPRKRGHSSPPPLLGLCIVAKRLDESWYGSSPRPRSNCVRWGSSFLRRRKWHNTPNFGPCLLWPNGWMDQDSSW